MVCFFVLYNVYFGIVYDDVIGSMKCTWFCSVFDVCEDIIYVVGFFIVMIL